VRTRIAARRAASDDAVSLGHEALRVVDNTDYVEQRVDARLALAEALVGAGREGEAAAALEEALRMAEAKGSTVLAREARARLERAVAR
jgi:hypothetical protein